MNVVPYCCGMVTGLLARVGTFAIPLLLISLLKSPEWRWVVFTILFAWWVFWALLTGWWAGRLTVARNWLVVIANVIGFEVARSLSLGGGAPHHAHDFAFGLFALIGSVPTIPFVALGFFYSKPDPRLLDPAARAA